MRAFFADAHAGLPLLSPDFWSNGAPFDADPMVNAWTPIGSTILISSVAPGMPAIFEWDWTVPTTANDHSCLLLLATCDQNALNASSTFVVDTLVPSQKLVTLKNLAVEDASAGEPRIRTQGLWLYNAYRGLARYDLVIDWATLPLGSELYFAFEKSEERFFAASDSDLKQAQAEWVKQANKILPERYPVRCGEVDIDDTALRLQRPKNHARTVYRTIHQMENINSTSSSALGLTWLVELEAKSNDARGAQPEYKSQPAMTKSPAYDRIDSPNSLLETGLHMCSPEKAGTVASFEVRQSILSSPVWVEILRNTGMFRRISG